MRLSRLFLAVTLALGALVPATAFAAPAAGGMFRYWAFTDGRDLRDVIAYYSAGRWHAVAEYWDFAADDTEDQFRPEFGVHIPDRRGSIYNFVWRHEGHQERFYIGTDQILSDHIVGRVEVSPIIADDGTSVVLSAGADYYWGSYNFLSATIIKDPREDNLWIYPMRARFANESNDWLQLTFAPASERSLGWAVDAKIKFLRVGIERNSRYDFTDADNFITTVGAEFPLGRRE